MDDPDLDSKLFGAVNEVCTWASMRLTPDSEAVDDTLLEEMGMVHQLERCVASFGNLSGLRHSAWS